jgi:hypothetical protein
VHEARKKTIGNFTSIYVSRLLRNKILSRCKGQWTAGRADNTNISFSLVMKRTKSVINIDHNLYLIVCETVRGSHMYVNMCEPRSWPIETLEYQHIAEISAILRHFKDESFSINMLKTVAIEWSYIRCAWLDILVQSYWRISGLCAITATDLTERWRRERDREQNIVNSMRRDWRRCISLTGRSHKNWHHSGSDWLMHTRCTGEETPRQVLELCKRIFDWLNEYDQ